MSYKHHCIIAPVKFSVVHICIESARIGRRNCEKCDSCQSSKAFWFQKNCLPIGNIGNSEKLNKLKRQFRSLNGWIVLNVDHIQLHHFRADLAKILEF